MFIKEIKYWIRHFLDILRPSYIYEVRYSYFTTAYFRTERAAYKYIQQREETDPSIYNGAEDIRLIKHKFYGERTDTAT